MLASLLVFQSGAQINLIVSCKQVVLMARQSAGENLVGLEKIPYMHIVGC